MKKTLIDNKNLNDSHKSSIDGILDLVKESEMEYGEYFIDKLYSRLDIVINNFNEEVELLLKNSFDKWKHKDKELRLLIKSKLPRDNNKIRIDNKKDKKTKDILSTPQFIKDVKFGPLRKK